MLGISVYLSCVWGGNHMLDFWALYLLGSIVNLPWQFENTCTKSLMQNAEKPLTGPRFCQIFVKQINMFSVQLEFRRQIFVCSCGYKENFIFATVGGGKGNKSSLCD